MLILFLLLSFIRSMDCNLTMIMFWGAPNDGYQCNTNISTDSFETCVAQCFNTLDCIVAYQVNSTLCMNCYWNDVNNITMLEPNTTKIALKMNMSSEDGERCPAGNVSSFASGKGMKTGSMWYGGIVEYTIAVSGNVLVLNVNGSLGCTWGHFFHSNDTNRCAFTCMMTHPTSYTEAVSVCVELRGTFAALDAPGLPDQVIKDFYSAVNTRIDGKLKASCVNLTSTAECEGIKGYDFVDEYLTSNNGMVFVNDTTGLDQGGCSPECLRMVFIPNDPRNGQVLRVCCDAATDDVGNPDNYIEYILCSGPADI